MRVAPLGRLSELGFRHQANPIFVSVHFSLLPYRAVIFQQEEASYKDCVCTITVLREESSLFHYCSTCRMLSPESAMLGGRAAAAFYYGKEKREIAYISDAYRLLEPAVGSLAAKILFGVALLASGQNSTITGTLAGGAFPSLSAFQNGSLLLGPGIIELLLQNIHFARQPFLPCLALALSACLYFSFSMRHSQDAPWVKRAIMA